MLGTILSYIAYAAWIMGAGFLILSIPTYTTHSGMRDRGAAVRAKVVRTFEEFQDEDNSDFRTRDYTFVAVVTFPDPKTGAPVEREHGYPELQKDVTEGVTLDMVYDAEGDKLILASDVKDPIDAVKTPLTIGGILVLLGLVTFFAARKLKG